MENNKKCNKKQVKMKDNNQNPSQDNPKDKDKLKKELDGR